MADYAISNVPRRVVYAASGTGPYAFTFEILAAGDIAVYKGDTLLTLTTDYSVTINANGTGSVTLVATAGTSNITIVGSKTIARTTDFTTRGDFFANTLNDELDAQTIFIQQIAETAERGLKAPVTDPTDINMTLPRKADRAGKYLAFDENGNPKPGDTAIEVAAVYAIRDEIVAVAAIDTEVVSVAGNSSNINTVASNISNVNTVAGVSGNVTTVATYVANVNTVADDLNEAVSEINTVAVNIANVNTVGTNISNVNSVAGNSTNINAVAGNATDIDTVAAISTDVSAVADIAVDVTTVSIIASDVTSVAGNTTNINAVAGNATNINAVNANKTNIDTVAGISSNVTTVATDIANINTVANDLNEAVSEIDTVATNITNVNNVGTNISSVNSCATNMSAIIDAPNQAAAAAASAAAAAASYDNFDDRYLGVKTADPTLDNDGNALVSGALYFNSGAVTPADKGMYVYDGAVWIPASAASSAILVVYQYTATAGQTTFSGSDNNALTLAYTAGSAIVTLNGVILEVPSEVTASSGSSVVLASGAAAGDELNVYAFSTFDIANVYTKAESDAKYVELAGDTITGNLTLSSANNIKLSVKATDSGNDRNATLELLSSGNGGSIVELIYGDTDTTPGSKSPLVIKGYHDGTLTERMRLTSTGTLELAQGQIKFPATQNASSDANTLDDYEEGTWTPSLGGTATYTGQVGNYIKIGRMVWASFDLTVNSIGSGNQTVITGLPFTSGGTATGMAGSIGYFASIAVGVAWLSIRIDLSATSIQVGGSTSTTTTTASPGLAIFGNGARLVATISYQTAS